MRRVAKINGVTVRSNTSPQRVSNTKITFTDGSWCDVATGVVESQPGCEIRLRGRFRGGSVHIQYLAATGNLRVSSSSPTPTPPHAD